MTDVAIDYAALFALTPTPLMVLDTRLCYLAANDAYLAVTGRRFEDLRGRWIFDAFPESGERLQLLRASLARALAGEANGLEKLVYAIARPGGGYVDAWWTCQHVPLRNAAGEVVAVMQNTVDVTAEVAADRMRDAISAEYDHRVRNILTKVSAIARRTARATTTMPQFIADFDPRISAMARTHQLLVHGGWERLSLTELVASELKPYQSRAGAQIASGGPDLMLSSRVAQALGMALHELATNAVKYGGLSQSDGRLAVEWCVDETSGALTLVWQESGLTGLAEPEPSGFGSTIIDRILPGETGGTVVRDFRATGLVCTIVVPAP